MSTIFISDMHIDARLGNIKTRDLLVNKLPKLIDLINKQDKCVFMGDYFNPANPDNSNREFFAEILNKINVPVIMVIGNHDRDKNGRNSLSAYKPLLNKNINIVEDYYEEDNYCYISYSLDIEHIINIINNTKCKYIVGHFSFEYESHGKIMKGELIGNGNEFKDKIFLLAHIHKSQDKGNVYYLGAMCPSKLDEIDYNFRLLIMKDNDIMEWKNIKYDLNNIISNNVDDILKNGNENSKVVIEVNSIEEKNKILAQLKDKKLLDLKFKIKNTGIDISTLKIEEMVKEYLKIQGREDLFDKVMSYIPEDRK
jgi:DNA repair exonuclease SbcCD nuclease subunit